MTVSNLSGQYLTGGYPDDMRGFSLKVKADGGAYHDANAQEMGMPSSLTLADDAEHGKVFKLPDGAVFVPKAGELAGAGIT